MVEEVEDRLNCVYNQGKQELDKQLKMSMEEKMETRNKMIEENSKLLPNDDVKQQEKEETRLKRDLSIMELKFTEAELERKRREKKAKQARIEAHLQEVERQKKLQQYCCQQQMFDMAQRFKNDEVNYKFAALQAQERRRQLEQFRSILKEQLDDKKRKEQAEVDCLLDDPYIQDDQKFFALARQYITDAKKKDRPLYPFIKAIEQYKRENQIDCVHTLPKHLLSKISIGCRQANMAKEAAVADIAAGKEKSLQECLKTTELLADGMREQCARNREQVFVGNSPRALACSQSNFYMRPHVQPSVQRICPTTLECQKCNVQGKLCAGEHIAKSEKNLLKSNSETDSKASGDGNKIRYSMSHLKYINQYKNASNNDSRIWY